VKAKYCLPDGLRSELRKQYGELYTGDEAETTKRIVRDMGKPVKLITVGDITTFNILESGIVPDVSVVDDKTRRQPASNRIVKGTRHPHFEIITVDNPAGSITEQLESAIVSALGSKKPVQIYVRGEEDLAALPVIALAPMSSVVVYGLPDQGAMMVRVTERIKNEISSLLEKMKCMNGGS